MQSYPSPNAGAGDGGPPFYSPSGQQQTGAPTPDDLQLTAQLSRGLAPIMNAGAGGNMSESQDSRGPSQGNVHQQYEHGSVHQGQIPSVHGSMDQMGGEYGTPEGSMAPRKRSKVSRACDECRRKKVRCDATGESDNEQCSNCKRVGTTCRFSRVPMKRGPSKGYIKELADRLNTLESTLSSGGEVPMPFPAHQETPMQRRPSEEFSPPPNTEHPSRKRTFSSVSGDFSSHLVFQPPKNWSPSESARHLPPSYAPQQSHPIFKDPNYTSNGMQASQDWGAVPEQHVQNTSFEAGRDFHPDHVLDWDEAIIDGYYQNIHPTYPLLQFDKQRLHARLDSAPKALKAAFYEALHAAVRSLHQPNDQQSTRRVAQLLVSVQFENFPRSMVTDLIYLQAYILLTIATNNTPSLVLGLQHTLPKSALLDAVNLAYSMKLHRNMPPPLGDDPDSDDRVARRLWWAVVSLDRWNAASTDRPSVIHDYNVVLHPEDQAVLGDVPYQLARLSMTLGHAARVLVSSSELPPLSSNPIPVIGVLLRGQLERLRESLPPHFFPPTEAPVFHICYWLMRILVELASDESSPTAMVDVALHLVTQLNVHSKVFSPLIHYCLALAALTLIELLEYENTRDDAENALKSLLSRQVHSSWDAAVRELITNRLQRPSSVSLGMSSSTVASQSLQRLADLATATGEGRDVAGGEDRKKAEKGIATVSASVNMAAGNHYAYFGSLRRLVGNGFLHAFESGGESAR